MRIMPTPPPMPTTTPPAVAPVSASASSPSLVAGQLLQAVVVGHRGDQFYDLATARGQLLAQSPQPLLTGQRLTLQVTETPRDAPAALRVLPTLQGAVLDGLRQTLPKQQDWQPLLQRLQLLLTAQTLPTATLSAAPPTASAVSGALSAPPSATKLPVSGQPASPTFPQPAQTLQSAQAIPNTSAAAGRPVGIPVGLQTYQQALPTTQPTAQPAAQPSLQQTAGVGRDVSNVVSRPWIAERLSAPVTSTSITSLASSTTTTPASPPSVSSALTDARLGALIERLPLKLPAPLLQSIQQFLSRLPSHEQLSTPEGVAHAWQQSGLFHEAQLRAGQPPPDLKTQLLQLWQTLNLASQLTPPELQNQRLWLRPHDPGKTRTSPPPGSVLPERVGVQQASGVSLGQFIDQLGADADGALSRMESHQLMHLLPREGQSQQPTWHMEWPVRHGPEYDVVKLQVRDEGSSAEAREGRQHWSLALGFDFEQTGPVVARVQIDLRQTVATEVAVQFHVPQNDTRARVETLIAHWQDHLASLIGAEVHVSIQAQLPDPKDLGTRWQDTLKTEA